MGGQPQRLGHKQSKGHSRFKKFVAGSVALGGLALGIKGDQEIKKAKNDAFEYSKSQASGDLQSLSKEAGLKKMGTGSEVVGADASGNIYGGAGILAGRGVEANPNIVRSAQGQLPNPNRLSAGQLAPFQPRREALRAVAGIVGGEIGVGEAVRDVARAGFQGEGGRRGQPNATEQFRQGIDRDRRAGGTLVAGATGDERFTAKESAKILGRRALRVLPFGG